mgnify:FL=1
MKEREEECSIERAEGSTSVVGDGVCKAKGWNGRWDVQGAGVECKIERKLVVKEAQACLVLPLRTPKGNLASWDSRAT